MYVVRRKVACKMQDPPSSECTVAYSSCIVVGTYDQAIYGVPKKHGQFSQPNMISVSDWTPLCHRQQWIGESHSQPITLDSRLILTVNENTVILLYIFETTLVWGTNATDARHKRQDEVTFLWFCNVAHMVRWRYAFSDRYVAFGATLLWSENQSQTQFLKVHLVSKRLILQGQEAKTLAGMKQQALNLLNTLPMKKYSAVETPSPTVCGN